MYIKLILYLLEKFVAALGGSKHFPSPHLSSDTAPDPQIFCGPQLRGR